MIDLRNVEVTSRSRWIVQEVSGIDLVDGDRPERREIQVAEVLLLALGRPAAIDVGDVVVGGERARLERPWRPHAGERPAVEAGRRRHVNARCRRQRQQVLALQERPQLVELRLGGGDHLARFGMRVLDALPGAERVLGIELRCGRAELLLRGG